ncbi:hypothetical protein SO802_000408 [Lithocarpus litseifolius]|uniref:Uncharacterized protein n=1 Tax=Lithocarpus litseifolius TaxID=425828 RepID=A0AAW2DT77_9ROSI
MAASECQALILSTFDLGQRHHLTALVELGTQSVTIEACSADSMDHRLAALVELSFFVFVFSRGVVNTIVGVEGSIPDSGPRACPRRPVRPRTISYEEGPNKAESDGSQHPDHFVHLKREWDREGSVHTVHTGKSRRRNEEDGSYQDATRKMQCEIDHLKEKLRRARRRRSPSNSPSITDNSSGDNEDDDYGPRSRTPPSESYSHEEEHYHGRRDRSTSSRGVGNDAMNRAFNQISKSPFTLRVCCIAGSPCHVSRTNPPDSRENSERDIFQMAEQ